MSSVHLALSSEARHAQLNPVYPPPCRQNTTGPELPALYTLQHQHKSYQERGQVRTIRLFAATVPSCFDLLFLQIPVPVEPLLGIECM